MTGERKSPRRPTRKEVALYKSALEICPHSPSGLRWKNRGREHFSCAQQFSAFRSRFAGKPAGYRHVSKGGRWYWRIKLQGKNCEGHRLVFLISGGRLKDGQVVDHRNGDGLDNRVDNLRAASHQQNFFNTKLSISNSSGFKGVTFRPERAGTKNWVTSIRIDGIQVTLGYFYSAEEAHAAYVKAGKSNRGKFFSDGLSPIN